MPMNRATFPKDLEEGLNAHFGMAYRDYPEEFRDVFDLETSRKAFEEDVLNYGFGAASVKAEGGEFALDEGGQAWTARYTHETIALGFVITEEALEDNLYERQGPKYARALARSMRHTKEIKAAAVLNNAFSSSYAGGDGVALLSTAHPLAGGGTFSNKLATPADLSEQALEDIMIQIRRAKDDRGVPVALTAKRLIIPPELEFTAIRLLQSNLRPGGNDNDINALRAKGVFANDPAAITRLTDADAWFIKTDCPEGLKLFQRVGIQRGTMEDFRTGNMQYKCRERYSLGWTDPRSLYGSEGAA